MDKPELQSFNWLIVGSQRTGKTVSALFAAAMLQIVAYLNGKTKRVIIFNPQEYNPMFSTKSKIQEAIGLIQPGWKMPGVFHKIPCSKILQVANAKSNLFDWIVVTDGELQDFVNQAHNLLDFIIIFDDLNNVIKGNLTSRKFQHLFTILAGNRIKCNEVFFTYHTFHQVPPSLWTYFQRAIIKETDDDKDGIGFKKIQKCRDVLTKAQMQVRAMNQVANHPNRLRLSELIVWLNEGYIFEQSNGELITKIGNVYHRAVGDDVEPLVP